MNQVLEDFVGYAYVYARYSEQSLLYQARSTSFTVGLSLFDSREKELGGVHMEDAHYPQKLTLGESLGSTYKHKNDFRIKCFKGRWARECMAHFSMGEFRASVSNQR